MNVLSYTSLSPFNCNEKYHIPPGKTCFSRKTLKKLSKLESSINKDRIDIEPTILDQESLPSDGSENAHMVRRLASALECSSEYCILQQDEVKKIMNEDEIKKEKDRFKIKGPRYTNTGTDGERHSYRVLLQWADIFNFFYPLPHILISENVGSKYELSVKNIMKIIKNQYPAVRVIAADISIEVKTDKACGWHAVVLLIDLRESVWTIEFFDSTGFPPNEIITKVMEELSEELKTYKKYLKEKGRVETIIVSGRIKHQLTSSECGLHALIYIRRRLEGIGYGAFSRYKIPDGFAKEFRRAIFVS